MGFLGRINAAARLLAAAAVTLPGITFLAQVSYAADLIQFQTIGKNFAPAAYCDGTPQTFLWTWSDGSTSTDYPIASKSFGASQSRTQYFNVEPLSALTNLNIGYDASDWGDTNNYTMRPTQKVRSIYFLQPLTNLQYWASSYNPITNTLDFTGFTALKDIECWHCTNLQHVVVSNLPSLRRVCLEACNLQSLDVSGDPNLEEIRAALNVFTNITVGAGTGPKMWHFCVRDNPQITQDFTTIMTNFYSLTEPWFWNANQRGHLSFVSSNLTDVEVFGNQYTSADFTGQSNMFELLIYENALTNLVINGCTALELFDASANSLPTAVIDALLTFLDTSCPNIQTVNLANNSYPSGVGYAHFVNLTNRGVSVDVDLPASFTPILSLDSYALNAEDCFPGNGAIDPGETVTMSFALKNTGIRNTTNLVATLLTSNGVTLPTAAQTYGVLIGGGPVVSHTFSFKASGSCGGAITPTLRLQDGASILGILSVPFLLGNAANVFSQTFDTVVVPLLPSGWSTTASNAQPVWSTISTLFESAPDCAFSPSATNVGVNELVSPPIAVPPGVSQLSFANSFDLEADTPSVGYDGGVLEIKIGTGAFTDILAAGGSFAANGYNRTISSAFGNPLGGRQAWSGNSGGFVTTVVNLPATAAGQTVRLRWRCGSDNNNALSGWRIDSVNITVQTCCDISAPPPPPVLQGIGVTNGAVVVTSFGAPGHTYRLQYKADLNDPAWTDIAPDIVPTNSTISISDTPGASAQRFYRIYRVQ